MESDEMLDRKPPSTSGCRKREPFFQSSVSRAFQTSGASVAWAVGRDAALGLVHRGLGPFLFFPAISSLPRGLCPCGPGRGAVGPARPKPAQVAVPLFFFLFLF